MPGAPSSYLLLVFVNVFSLVPSRTCSTTTKTNPQRSGQLFVLFFAHVGCWLLLISANANNEPHIMSHDTP